MTEPIELCRSWLYAPGDNAKLVERVSTAGADAVLLDLEDAVKVENKPLARTLVAAALQIRSSWVRINPSGSEDARRDLAAIGSTAVGIRVPKVESPEEIEWVRLFLPGVRIVATIESAAGVAAAEDIAAHPSVVALALGAADLSRDLSLGGEDLELLYVRSKLVVISRAAGIAPPIDSVFRDTNDLEGLRLASQRARSLGFSGKSAIHPRQVQVINDAFTPTPDEMANARAIVDAFEASGGQPTTLAGVFVDAPVVDRAAAIIRLGESRQ